MGGSYRRQKLTNSTNAGSWLLSTLSSGKLPGTLFLPGQNIFPRWSAGAMHSGTDAVTNHHVVYLPLTNPSINPLNHPPTLPPTQSLTHLPTYPITDPSTHPLTRPPAYPLTNSPTYPTTYSPTHPHTHPIAHTPIYPPTHPRNLKYKEAIPSPLPPKKLQQPQASP